MPLIFINNQKPFSTYRSVKQNAYFVLHIMHFSFPKLFFHFFQSKLCVHCNIFIIHIFSTCTCKVMHKFSQCCFIFYLSILYLIFFYLYPSYPFGFFFCHLQESSHISFIPFSAFQSNSFAAFPGSQ